MVYFVWQYFSYCFSIDLGIRFANRRISIANKGIEALFRARNSLLYYNDEPWVKKGESNSDVRMGAYNGAEICELIGIFILSLLSKHINKNHIGLYRDDGLATLKNTSAAESEKFKKKKFQKIFKEKDLDITVQCNLGYYKLPRYDT